MTNVETKQVSRCSTRKGIIHPSYVIYPTHPNPLSPSREQRTEGLAPSLPSARERAAKARGVGGVSCVS